MFILLANSAIPDILIRIMKNYLRFVVLLSVFYSCLLYDVNAKSSKGVNKLSLGGRYYAEQEDFPEIPFGDGDVAYGVAYEYHESAAAWQLAATYCPDVTGDDAVDYIITPEVNLIVKDGIWRGGIGMLYSYLERDDHAADDDEWVGPYWQLLFGLNIPFFGMDLKALTYYDFESFNDLDEFELDKLDYGVWVSFSF